MLQWLVDHGFELGNHTKDHVPFNKLRARPQVQKELVLGNAGDRGRVAGLPRPDDGAAARRHAEADVARAARALERTALQLQRRHARSAPALRRRRSANRSTRAGIPRIRSGHLPWNGEADFGAWYWLRALKQNPERRYVSDGDPATIAFPRALQKNLRRAFSSRARVY